MAIEVARRATGELSRTGLELRQLAEAWARRPQGERFVRSLATFLGSKSNKGTQRVYGFAITEFFAWYRSLRGIYPTPSEVRREDAALFVKWLQERSLGVDEERLAQDPERVLDLVAYRFIKKNPESRIGEIRRELLNDSRLATVVEFRVRGIPQTARVLKIEENQPRGDDLETFRERFGADPESALDLRLACLCQHNLLRRSPSIVEIRQGLVDLGLEKPDQAQIGYRVDPEVFRYWANEYTQSRGGDRAGTIVTKLSALSSYWSYLVKSTGENQPGSDALLRFNIWRELLGAIRPTALNRAQAHREESVPDRDLFVKLLSSTFVWTHRSDATQAAAAFLEGADVRGSEFNAPRLYDLRDRAVLTFMFWTGVRAEELGSIRRSDLNARTGIVTVTGKGDKRRSFRVPDPALRAIYEFQSAVERLRQKEETDLRALLREPSAPLFPPLKLWGRAQRSLSDPSEVSGLTPSAIAKLLHERAEQVGIEAESDEWYRLHPHGIRHLAALEAKRRGVDVATIQATLGHASLAHTGIYLEVRDPAERSLQPTMAKPEPVMPPPVFEARVEPEAERGEKTKKPRVRVTKPSRIVEPEAKTRVRLPVEPEPTQVEPEEVTIIEPLPQEAAVAVVERPGELVEELLEPEEQAALGAEDADALAVLYEVYRDNWGEAGTGKRTAIIGAKLEGLLTEEKLERGALAHAYVGVVSALPWWGGTTGEFKGEFHYTPNDSFPAMPILSPAQFLTDEDGRNELAERLSRVVEDWADPKSPEFRGMTAVAAFEQWLRVADEVSEASTNVIIELRKGRWVPFDSPLVVPEKPPATMREHELGAVEAWFRSTAWQWRPRQGRIGVGTEFQPPAWYDEPDPLKSMPDADRKELLDWLRVLVGDVPRDATPRFGDQSRASIGQLMGQMCLYESTLREEGGFETEGVKGISKALKKQLAETDKGIQLTLTSKLQKAPEALREEAKTWSYAAAKAARSSAGLLDEAEDESDSDEPQKKKRALSDFYLSVVEHFFGEEAAKDPILQIYALCTQGPPLRGVRDFQELFRVEAGTIRHDEVFKRRFAEQHGQHSECVARRLARHLWEAGKPKTTQKRRRWASDPLLNSLLEYKIPCPREQEEELKRLFPSAASAIVRTSVESFGVTERKRDLSIFEQARGGEQDPQQKYEMKLVGQEGGSTGQTAARGADSPTGGRRRIVANPVPFWMASRIMRQAYRR